MEKRPSFKGAAWDKASAALSTRELSVFGKPLSLFGAGINLTLEADEVELLQAARAPSQIILFPGRVRSGRLIIETQRTDLEQLVKRVIVRQAGKQGVTVENVVLSLESTNPRALGAVIAVTVRKLFITTTLRISGEVTIDETFAARLRNLHCDGEGNFGALGCAMLAPHLIKLEGRSFPLSALARGTNTLRDLRIDIAGEQIALRAEFA